MGRITLKARALRSLPTPSELKFWLFVRQKKLNYAFTRQKPISYALDDLTTRTYYIDFYCSALKLGFELDGPIHDYQKDYDAFRDSVLASLGIVIYRIKNQELEDDTTLKTKLIKLIDDRVKQLYSSTDT